jgi:hypothetical protein
MNLKKLQNNYTYDNYKKICQILEEPIKTGKSKQLQLKDWHRYFNYKKDRNKFVITEIFDTPKQKVTTHSTKCKKAVDNRTDNGGNNTSIISDYMRNWINITLDTDVVDGSASKIIRDMHLVVADFNNAYYNFDDCFDSYAPIEKQFFLDYCDVIMNSYKQRLKRIINNLVENSDIEYKEYYQINFMKSGKYGEYIATDDIEDLETIDKIDKAKHQVESFYGAKENKDKWKLYCNRETSNKFQDDFIKKVRKILKRDDIVNCYKAMFLCEHGTYEADINESFDNRKFWDAQKKFAEDKIKTVFNKQNKIPLGFGKYEKLPKYRHEDISQDMIKDCKDIIVYESVS